MQRWATVVDVLIGVVAVTWVAVLVTVEPGRTLRWAVPLVLALLVVHRVLLVLELGSATDSAERPGERPRTRPGVDLPEAA